MSVSRGPSGPRVNYFDGQLLAARDLNDDAANERALRGLHQRGLHDTWGVALGFEVSRPRDDLIRVGPGLAYDARGREIVSSQTVNLGRPVVPAGTGSWWFDLVVSATGEYERPPGNIGCTGASDLAAERPRWRWALAGASVAGGPPPPALAADVRLGEEIPLVRCRVSTKGFDPALDFSVRRNCQAMVRPHAFGAVTPVFLTSNSQLAALSATVPTSAGGFSTVPFYFARITIPALLDEEPEAAGLQGPFVSLRGMTRTAFTIDVRVAFQRTVILLARARADRGIPALVTWLGVEPNGGCVPDVNLLSRFFVNLPAPFLGGLFINPAIRTSFRGGFNG